VETGERPEIEITSAMIEAGVAVCDSLKGVVSEFALVEEVYSAMASLDIHRAGARGAHLSCEWDQATR